MPWTGSEFASKHNKKLKGAKAEKAAKIATAMVKRGVPEGESIATANKRVKSMGHGIRKDSTAKGMAGQRRTWRGA